MKKIATLLFLACFYLFVACSKTPEVPYSDYGPEEKVLLDQYLNLPDVLDNYKPQFPSNMIAIGVTSRKIDSKKAVLGRVLFYDKHLSKDGKISCGSCHRQEIGFGDDKRFSTGVFDRVGTRNTLPLLSATSFASLYDTEVNGQFAVHFFWDHRSETIREMVVASWNDSTQMDMQMDEVVAAVESQPYYAVLFQKAYGDAQVDAYRVTDAMASFVNAIGSFQSRFDQAASKSPYRIDLNFSDFNDIENRGKTVYINNCAGCHGVEMDRADFLSSNNGLDADLTGDPGIGGVTGAPGDQGKFKVPNLRNIALTAPYMHDGRFQTLEEVIEHYNSGVQNHPNLGFLLQTPSGPKRLNLTEAKKQELVAFLHTLTDETARTDSRFSNPFR